MSVENGASKVKSPFVTTTQVMNSINEQLSSVDLGGSTASTSKKPHFELQRKFADGRTRKATESEAAAADMNSKLQQAAVHVAKLSTKEKREWADSQRQLGNKLYEEKEFKEAIDVYLTCLIVAQEDDKKLLFLKVMNNLAQSALQLGWNKKAIEFSDLALSHIDKNTQGELETEEDKLQMMKLYFKRGKAERLGGHYTKANESMVHCRNWIGKFKGDQQKFLSLVEGEENLTAKSELEARRNKDRQTRAMKKVLDPRNSSSAGDSSTSLYSDKPTERKFSTIRAPKEPEIYDLDNEDTTPTYWRIYWTKVGNVAKTLLVWLGDEDYVESHAKQD